MRLVVSAIALTLLVIAVSYWLGRDDPAADHHAPGYFRRGPRYGDGARGQPECDLADHRHDDGRRPTRRIVVRGDEIDLACSAEASPGWVSPFTTPGGNPVTRNAGWTPRLPPMTVDPLLVTAGVPASTANVAAEPSTTGTCPVARTGDPTESMPTARIAAAPAGRSRLAPRRRVSIDAVRLGPAIAVSNADRRSSCPDNRGRRGSAICAAHRGTAKPGLRATRQTLRPGGSEVMTDRHADVAPAPTPTSDLLVRRLLQARDRTSHPGWVSPGSCLRRLLRRPSRCS